MRAPIIGKLQYVLGTLASYQNGFDLLYKTFKKQPVRKLVLRDGTKVYGNENSLLHEVADEVFTKLVYTDPNVFIEDGDVVVDIGANVGVFSLFAFKEGAKRVYAYEPIVEHVVLIRKNLRENSFDAFEVVNCAVARKKGARAFDTKEKDAHGSFF